MLLHELIFASAARTPDADALQLRDEVWSYAALASRVEDFAGRLVGLGVRKTDRVAVFLDKRFEFVIATFGAAAAGGVFVPVNPILKPAQVQHIMTDCNVRVLVTSAARLTALAEIVGGCPDLRHIVLTDGDPAKFSFPGVEVIAWDAPGPRGAPYRTIDDDMLAILYTSGSTGRPKGVVLSHRNMVAGAVSVSTYLENTPDDRILCVLPFSFDAGFSQMTTSFRVGACAVLMNYLLPNDVVRAAGALRITGIGGVPPLWNQLAALEWPDEAKRTMRYFTNTGGHMPRATLDRLRASLPTAKPYLMYGLTEAFRSTYLPPSEVDNRPDSMGKAIPNAEILVVNEKGELCGANEPGELVHRGALVSLGYWNDPERTAERFKPAPGQLSGLPMTEFAVWSGDTVRMDEEGYLYFVGRRDEMIKSSGYRISPTEVEEVIYSSGTVTEAVALGIPHPVIGQGIVVVATPPEGRPLDPEAVIKACRDALPQFMVPHAVVGRDALERNPNGKIDRKKLSEELSGYFEDAQ
jgi:acyl-CoA ligase (AMP-forming) (exosortase A-associated)